MRHLFVVFFVLISVPLVARQVKATTIKKGFSRETSVSVSIRTDSETVWNLLVDASYYPSWNSTVVSIEGDILPRQKIMLKSTLDEKKTFKLKIKEFEPNKRLVWGSGRGNRVFTLEQKSDQEVLFTMAEKIGGLMFPLYAGLIPSFDDSFETFAMDLKREAERRFNIENDQPIP